MNAKEATKAAAKQANSDGIGGDTGNSGPDVEEADYLLSSHCETHKWQIYSINYLLLLQVI